VPIRPQRWPIATFVYATTARPRDMTKPVLLARGRHDRDAAARIAAGEKVAVMFGPERAGLENDDDRAGGGHHLGSGEPGVSVAEPGTMRAADGLRMAAPRQHRARAGDEPCGRRFGEQG
jgi:hypothetical protein